MSPETRLGQKTQGLMLPSNVEAEASVLGSILLEGQEKMELVVDRIRPTDFYRKANQLVFDAMLHVFKKNQELDILTVTHRLEETNNLEQVGGASYLADLTSSVPSTTNLPAYAKIVEEASIQRQVISVAGEVRDKAYEEDFESVKHLVDFAQKKLFEVGQDFTKRDFTTLVKELDSSFERYDLAHQNKGQLHGVPTGFKSLDNKLSGLQPANLVILATRPSMGKTTLALNIARNAAVKHGKKIGMFSLEMSSDQLVDRLVSLEAGIDSWKLRTGLLGERDFTKIANAMDALSRAEIFVDDNSTLSVMDMRARARRLHATKGLDLVIVDYLQMMDAGGNRSDNRVQEISDISRALKSLARELEIPVLALSQLSRAVEQRDRKQPELSDLRESGAIEQDADVVMFIYRDEYYHPKDTERPNIADIMIKKHRNGPTGQVELYFSGDRQKFTDLEKHAPTEAARPSSAEDGAAGSTTT